MMSTVADWFRLTAIACSAAVYMVAGAPALAEDDKAAEKADDKWDVSNPPGEPQDVTIDVDQGTWMSLDVSPDGATIVFDLLGDIYTMPITGGEATAISEGVSWDMQPRFSPDGAQIAFTSDRGGGDNIWIMGADGSAPRQVSKEDFRLPNNPAWSPDGRFIAARKHFTSRRSLGGGEIWLYHVGGGKGVQLNERPNDQKDLGEPVYSADGRYVYFSQDTTPGDTFQYSKDSNKQIYEIRQIDLENGDIRSVVSGPGGAARPTPSPDGKYLAFVRRIRAKSALFLKDLESGEVKPIYRDLDQDMQETWAIHGVYPNMDWTPDSKSIVFWAGGAIRRIEIAGGAVTDIPFHVRQTLQVMEAPRLPVEVAPETFETKMLRWVQVSPDGGQVVFQALGYLYVRDLPGGEPRRLTRQSDHFELYPSFSADGDWIVYSTWDDDELGSIRKVRARGGRSNTLTREPGHYIEPRFSPDGQTVVFERIAGGFLTSPLWSEEPGVYRVPAAGGASELVTRDGAGPRFGAAGDRVFITRDRDDKHYLVSIDFDGEAARDHATTEFGTEYGISPDGNWLAFVENYHVYVAPLADTGGAVALGPELTNVPTVKVSRDGGGYLSWSGDSATVHWSMGPELFSANISDIFAQARGASEDAYEPTGDGISLGFSEKYAAPEGSIALTGARIVTMNNDLVIEDGTIVIRSNRIVSVGPSENIDVGDDVRRIDLSGKTIIPGIIDIHAHGAQGTSDIIPQDNWRNYASLALGVTTIHDPSNPTSTIFAASEMAKAGLIVAPRIYSTGSILYGAKHELLAAVDSLEDARSHMRRLKAVGAFSVKNYNQPRRDQRQQIMTAAREEGMMVVAEGGSLYHFDMTLIVDGNTGVEHSLPQAAIYDDVKQFWSQTKVGYTPTMVVGYGGIAGERYWYQHTEVWKHPLLSRYVPPFVLEPRSVRRIMAPEEDYEHPTNARMGKELQELGVLVNIGAHGQREGLAAHWEIWMFEQGGMTPLQALRTATIDPARYMGLDKDLGSIEPGKLADLVVLDRNPLERLRDSDKVYAVMINGRLYEAATMNELAPGERKGKNFFWRD